MENMTIEEINKEIERLSEIKRKLKSQKYKDIKANAEKYVGKYFFHYIYNESIPTIGIVQDVDNLGNMITTELTYDEFISSLDGDHDAREIKYLTFISKEDFMSMLEDRLEMIRNTWRGKTI